MGTINWGRVFLGGLLWGLVVNVLWNVPRSFGYFEELRIVLQTLGQPRPGRLALQGVRGFTERLSSSNQ